MLNYRYWECPVALTKKEELICKRLKSHGKLFVFLRKHRHLIFNDDINKQLIAMYADHPKGKPPDMLILNGRCVLCAWNILRPC